MQRHRPAVSITPLQTGHGALLFGIMQAESIYEYLDELPPQTVQQLEQRHAFMLDPDSPPAGERWLNWLITTSESGDNNVAGTVQATIYVQDRLALVAYILAPQHWGRGFAFAAVQLMLEDLVTNHGVEVARAYIDPQNRRSIALVERLGFTPADMSPDDEGNLVYDCPLDTYDPD